MMMRPLMRWLFLFGSLLAACDTSSTVDLDFGLVLPGCRAPSACYRTNCGCNFSDVTTLNSDDPTGCLLCDPNDTSRNPSGVCDCAPDGGVQGECLERAQVCVGHGVACNSSCARVGVDMGCSFPTDPPEAVVTVQNDDGGPGTERRCQFSDDICCQ
jgi:hypothetical protein